MMVHRQYILGVYGSHVKTEAVLVTIDGTLVAEESGAPSDLQMVGFDQAAQEVLRLAVKCCQKATCRSSDLFAVGIGLTGAERVTDRTEFHNRLLGLSRKEKFPFGSIMVETGARVALEAAFASGPGIVLTVGAGSIAYAKGETGQIYHAGSSGTVIGGEGGGHFLAREAHNAVLRACDGRGHRTVLLNYALEHFGVPSVDDLVFEINHKGLQITSFLPKLFQAEREGDHVAHGVLFRGATELFELVRVLTMQIQPKRKLPVSLMGELLEEENVYSKMVRDKIIHSLPHLVVQKPKFPPVFGGVLMVLKPFEFKEKPATTSA